MGSNVDYGFVIALNSESQAILPLVKVSAEKINKYIKIIEGCIGDKTCAIVVSGVGKVNAGVATQYMIDHYSPKLLFNIGTAGGLKDDMSVGDCYLVTAGTQFDFDITAVSDGYALGQLNEYDGSFIDIDMPKDIDFTQLRRVKLGTADRFNDDKSDYDNLISLGADIRDMEGSAIIQTCYINDVPLVMIKTITDIYGTNTGKQFHENKMYAVGKLAETMRSIFSNV